MIRNIPYVNLDTMTGESSAIRKYDVDFKKTPGTLSITSTHIIWVPKVKDAMDRQSQAMNRAISEFFPS